MNPEDGTTTAAGKGERGWKKLGFGSSLLIDFFPHWRAEANCYL